MLPRTFINHFLSDSRKRS